MRKYIVIILMLFFLIVPSFAAQEKQAVDSKIKAAIFIQNRAQDVFQNKIGTLNDLITNRLTQKGFVIIDKHDVLARFKEPRIADPELTKTIKALSNLIKFVKTEAPVEDSISDASALRIAQIIQANYLIFVTINSYGEESKKFKGKGTVYGSDSEVTDYTLRLALKVTDSAQSGTIYGDMVKVSERVARLANLEIQSSEVINKLLDSGSAKLAENIAGKIEDIRKVGINKLPLVEFTLKSNVRGAIVELDGAAIGSAPGNFKAVPGLHQLRVSKERYATWEKTVNIYAGQVLNINLELSAEGLERAKEQKEMDSLLYRKTRGKEEGSR